MHKFVLQSTVGTYILSAAKYFMSNSINIFVQIYHMPLIDVYSIKGHSNIIVSRQKKIIITTTGISQN